MTLTNTQIFAHMKTYMEDATKYDNYYLQELKSDGFLYTSYFKTKDDARHYAREFCEESSAIYIFKTTCVRIYDPVENNESNLGSVVDSEYNKQNSDFREMILWKYGRGYLLVPPTTSNYFGTKYFF